MKVSIRITGDHPGFQSRLAEELRSLGYEIAEGALGQQERTTFGIICIGGDECITDGNTRSFTACHYPIVISTSTPQDGRLVECFQRGAYAHIAVSAETAAAKEVAANVKEHIDDILYMSQAVYDEGPRIQSPRLWSHVLFDSLPEGIAVIDRQFRTWYRNKAHIEIAGDRGMDCSLCWVRYHGLVKRSKPCDGCPSRKLFSANSNRPTDPTPMIIGFDPPEDDRRPARATEVQVIPLFDEARQRVVGAVEIVRDLGSQLGGKGPHVAITACVELILEKVFRPRFTRARLFLLSPNRKNLMGFAAVGLPAPSQPIKSLHVPVGANAAGVGLHLPSQPTVVRVKDLSGRLPQYCNAFDKKHAPCWGDIPFHDENGLLIGKVVVDRWSRSAKGTAIREEELHGFEKGLQLLSSILREARALQNATERIAVAEATEELLTSGLLATSSAGGREAYNSLLLATEAIPGVLSAVIREEIPLTMPGQEGGDDRRETRVLRYVDGFGAYSRHCEIELPVAESVVAGAVAADPSEHSIVVESTPETLRLRERRLEDVRPANDREEMKSIKYQGTFRIVRQPGDVPASYLSVQATSFNVFEHETLRLLPRAAELTLTMHHFATELSSCFLDVMKLHDVDTGVHSRHVAEIARILAADVPGATPERAYVAGCLHDIGKIGLSRDVLRSFTPLNPAEWWYVRAHVEVGSGVLKGFSQLADICLAVGEHHRWFDGSGGYPSGENGYKISPLGRILAVADCLEAMTSPARYYKEPKPLPQALEIVEEEVGKHFCPEVAAALRKNWAEIESYLNRQRRHS